MPTKYTPTRLLEGLTGFLLLLVGLGFLLLLAVLKLGGLLTGDLKVSAFMFAFGATLIWFGLTFFLARPEEIGSGRRDHLVPLLLKLRSGAELIAAVGCALLLCHVVTALGGIRWPAKPIFEALLVGPVAIGLFTLKILLPGAFQSSVFPDKVVRGWSADIRRLLDMLVRVGWFGYVALPLAWPDVNGHLPTPWRGTAEFLACLLISILYASQLAVLHFGEMRRSA